MNEQTAGNLRNILMSLHKAAAQADGRFDRKDIYDACAAIGISQDEWNSYELLLTNDGWAEQKTSTKFVLTPMAVNDVEYGE